MTIDHQELYQQLILDHNRHPKNFRVIDEATGESEGYNPLCGDRYHVYVNLEGSRIEDIAFQGTGCAISRASASLMTHLVRGKTPSQAEEMFVEFQQLVTGEVDPTDELSEFGAFAGIRDHPSRIKCATLGWHTLKAALDGTDKATTE